MKQIYSLFILFFAVHSVTFACLDVTSSVTDVTCFGSSDGSIELTPTSGQAPYTFSLTGGVETSPGVFTELASGCYDVTVVDDLGCDFIETICVIEPTPLVANNNWAETCAFNCTGFGEVWVSGGVQPYTYQWDSGDVGQFIENICPGYYIVTVTDANLCTTTADLIVTELPPLTGTVETTDETCLGNDGTATVIMDQMNPPYWFSWSDGQQGEIATGLVAGDYSVWVTDSWGCEEIFYFTINGLIDFELNTTVTSCDTDDGTASVDILFGAPNPAYAWSNGETTQNVTGLAPGGYSVTVTDLDSGCTKKENLFITEDIACKVRISGYVYVDDENPDCLGDVTTYPAVDRVVELSNGMYDYTDANGFYEFVVDDGNYDVVLVPKAVDIIICPASNTINVDAIMDGTSYPNNDFYLKYDDVQDVCVSISSGAHRPGFNVNQYIYFCNYGGDTISGSLTYTHDLLLDGFNPDMAPVSYDNMTGVAVFDMIDVAPYECRRVRVSFTVPVGTPLGTSISIGAVGDPITGDANPDNNSKTVTRTVTGSYDPNDKQNLTGADPFGGDIPTSESKYEYLIRFQNTGTDTAFTVVVKDTIDTNLDLSSIRVIGASHSYEIRTEPGNTAVFYFDNIMLPDSFVNEPLSNGFIHFDIDLKPNLPIGTVIENSGAIYFDFNSPIITNTVINEIRNPVGISEVRIDKFNLSIQPNPANKATDIFFELEEDANIKIDLFTMTGIKVATYYEGLSTKGIQSIPLSVKDLANGVYFVRLSNENGQTTKKLVVSNE